MAFTLKTELPSEIDFVRLRQSVSWGTISQEEAELALANSLCGISLLKDEHIIGMARVIGDGVLNIYIQDVIVDEDYRNQGCGTTIMNALILLLKDRFPPKCSVGLMAATGQAGFYKRYGFLTRPSKTTDAGMMCKLSALQIL
jgi:predicted GNAT family N-acyltransferase